MRRSTHSQERFGNGARHAASERLPFPQGRRLKLRIRVVRFDQLAVTIHRLVQLVVLDVQLGQSLLGPKRVVSVLLAVLRRKVSRPADLSQIA
jgi:hypothetical protein